MKAKKKIKTFNKLQRKINVDVKKNYKFNDLIECWIKNHTRKIVKNFH